MVPPGRQVKIRDVWLMLTKMSGTSGTSEKGILHRKQRYNQEKKDNVDSDLDTQLSMACRQPYIK